MKISSRTALPKFFSSAILLALILGLLAIAPSANATTYTVTYVGTGSTSGTAPVDTNQYSSGSSFTILGSGTLQKKCYDFGGWQNASIAPSQPGQTYPISNNVSLAPWWTPVGGNNYTLTFNGNGNTTGPVPSALVGCGMFTLPAPGTMTKDCSTFLGWSPSPTLGSPSGYALAGDPFDLGGNSTWYALWTPVPCTLTFDANGGTGNVPGSISGPGSFNLPGQGALTLACFTFGGWSLNGTVPPLTNPYQVTGNTILKAIWLPTGNCTLTFDANGGTGNVPGAISGPGPITLPGAGNLTLACFTFGGWSAVAGAGLPLTSLSISGPTTVFALWTAVTYTLTFDKNGGAGSAPLPIVGCGNVPLPGVGTMTNPGNTFGGWSLNGNAPPLTTPYPLGSNTTLFAIWTPVTCTVTFGASGGTGPLPLPHLGCSNFTLPAPSAGLIKSCFNFQGWSLSGNGPAITFVPAYTPPTGITVLNAVWMHVIWKITYVKNGGTGNVPTPTLGCGLVTLKGNTGGLSKPGGVLWKGWRTPLGNGGTNYNWPWLPLNYNLITHVTMYARYSP